MVKYSNSSIYKLCCKDVDITEIYIGSTTNFKRRKCGHKTNCNTETLRGYIYPVYQFIRSNGGFENWDMIQIEQYSATDKRALHSRERYWIEQLKPSLNGNLPSRTIEDRRASALKYFHSDKGGLKYQEYREINKQHIINQRAEFRAQNKERLVEKHREPYTCKCGGRYTTSSKARHYKTIKHQFWLTTYNFIHS